MLSAENSTHIPVLCSEALDLFDITPQKIIVDATFGGGGYTKALLDKGVKKVIAFDRDPDAALRAQPFKENFGKRFEFHLSCFSDLHQHIAPHSIDGIVFDFGISSFQVDQPHRGFSFRHEGNLDMRMGIGATKTAADVVNTFSERDLCDIIYYYGEESKARPIARAIVEKRAEKPFQSTTELAAVIRKVVHHKKDIDPATLTFQALRIFVNNELIEIEQALQHANNLLPNEGRLVTVAFHSLEDRMVKLHSQKQFVDHGMMYNYAKINKKVIAPSATEIQHNPRARSAKLRGFIKKAQG